MSRKGIIVLVYFMGSPPCRVAFLIRKQLSEEAIVSVVFLPCVGAQDQGQVCLRDHCTVVILDVMLISGMKCVVSQHLESC